jgi:hypothetical protein
MQNFLANINFRWLLAIVLAVTVATAVGFGIGFWLSG